MKEIWKDVKGYKGYYKVSNTGKVMSLGRWKETRKGVWHKMKDKLLQTNQPYSVSAFCKNGKHKMFKVSRLVATYFLSNPEKLPLVVYKKGLSNNVNNLKWGRYGDHKKKQVIQVDAKTGKKMKIFSSSTEASLKTGICKSSISIGLDNKNYRTATGWCKWISA